MTRFLLTLLTVLLSFAAPVSGDSVEMRVVTDLRSEAGLLRENNLVLVLEFSSEYCAYCRLIEEKFLLPMQRNRDYDDQVLIRSISLDSFQSVIDFSGELVDTDEFASRYDVSVTPTLVFLNSEGRQLSKKLVGIWSEDFFGGLIDDRIGEARAGL